ncbi:MAG: hypothetical protein DRH03_05675 [Deltaproteobacteria bacterium]|nr:MAG: hypothetical protein DRH03_05675 [Deltaproteobacteria bacterium]
MSEKQNFPVAIGNWTKGLCLILLLVGLLAGGTQVQANEIHNSESQKPVTLNGSGNGDLLPIPIEVPKPRTNEECIKCHKEPNLTSGRLDGSKADLHIEYKLFKETLHGQKLECIDCHEDAASARHCRSGFQKVNCLACHSKIKGLYPFGAQERLAKKKIKIPKRKIVGDSYYKDSAHGKALLAGKKDAPNCFNCHTRHYIFGKKSAKSTINRFQLTQTCSVCHKDRKVETLLEKASTFRVEAHRKGDLSFDYDRGNCIDCHQGEAVHGLKVNDAPCSRCHNTKAKIDGVKLFGFGPFHLYPDYEKQYSTWCVRNLYGILLLLLLAGLGCCLFIYILKRSADYYRKEGGE